jgi:hypothetical protein
VGDEPADVIEYRSRQPKFPHESTADQFFSESQFESYRRLGLHIIRDALEGVSVGDEAVDLRRIFQDLTRKWYAPIPVTPEAASRLADSYTSLIRSLGENPALEPFIAELLPKTPAAGNGSPVLISKDYLVFGNELIQLMENVYTEFNLHYAANRANPRNAGWMQAFGRWAQSDLFYNEIWRRVEQDYNPLFRDFMRDLRDRCGDDVPMRS